MYVVILMYTCIAKNKESKDRTFLLFIFSPGLLKLL